ncbi:MAG: phosphatase PAP2 family protein [Desulfovibrio sp.]|jgi:acid phosphatase (class A)|nr:phosphatase PAP2 family protein [Desulfovibrio sp.]
MKRFLFLPVFFLLVASLSVATGADRAPNLLNPGTVPNSLAFLPEPPAEGSIDFKRDQDTYLETRKLAGTGKWEQAAFDADRRANWPDFFRDAFGMSITREKTPFTYDLLSKAFPDFNAAAAPAKNHYNRTRPYRYYNSPGSTCLPKDEERLSNNGSYPSGHSGYGWGMALILAEISPERQDAIMKRGYEFGYSRVVCGYHWVSDVDAGRLVAAAVVAQMHNNSVFTDLLAKAKAEIREAREKAKP